MSSLLGFFVCALGIANSVADGHWWETQVMYQIYPRSFQDSDGDGTGDLKGIQQRLPYLKQLGVGFIWLSPVMKSPMRDFGYDISDFQQVDPLFGSMKDMQDLIDAAKQMGIRILMDFVPNHNSNESEWFKQSRSSKTNPKRNWYIWHPGTTLANGTRLPPNNWASNFGGGLGSSWTWDETSQEYYYHAFGEFQPDLNYRNPEVVEAMKDVLRFWLRMGVGGFRIDAVPFLLEDPNLTDESFDEVCAKTAPVWNCMVHNYTQNDPKNHDIIRGWRKTVDEFDERVMFGEIYADLPDLMQYYGTKEEPEFNVPFNFEVLGQNYGQPNDLTDTKTVRDAIRNYSQAKPDWCHGNWVLGNHDNHRLMDRLHNNTALTATLYALLNLLPGTPTIYNGDEIAMNDLFIPYSECQDPMCIKNPDMFVTTGRDPERTPMQWNAGPQAGFSTNSHTWLPINPNHVTVNVETEQMNLSTPLPIMMATLAYRASNPSLALGQIKHVPSSLPNEIDRDLVIVQFSMGSSVGVTVANWNTSQSTSFDLTAILLEEPSRKWQIEFSTDLHRKTHVVVDAKNLLLNKGEVAVITPLQIAYV